MTSTLVLTIAFGLFIGYWVVSKLLTPQRPQTKPQPEEQAAHARPEPPPRSEAWFDILKVSPAASVDEIQAAFKSQIRQYHPDKVASLGPELRELAEEKSKAINTAYQEALRERGG